MAFRYAAQPRPEAGETRYGSDRAGVQGGMYVESNGGASLGSWLALDGISAAGAGTTWYLFVTSAGVLRIANARPTNTETDGSAV